MRNAGLEEAQAGIKIAVSNINNLRYVGIWHPYGRKWRWTKKPLDESERGEWKSWLKAQHSENEDHGIWPITSWQIYGGTMEIVTDFIFLGSQITIDSDYNHEIKRHLLPGRKAMSNLDSILKSRDIADKVKAMVFLSHVWMWELDHKESWEQKTDAFELWCWIRFLKVPWTARRSNQLILKKKSVLNIHWKDWSRG